MTMYYPQVSKYQKKISNALWYQLDYSRKFYKVVLTPHFQYVNDFVLPPHLSIKNNLLQFLIRSWNSILYTT